MAIHVHLDCLGEPTDVEGVCWHVLCLPPPHTLEQIVRKDMARNGTWMDLRLDAEIAGFEMGDTILAELIEDTILMLCGVRLPDVALKTRVKRSKEYTGNSRIRRFKEYHIQGVLEVWGSLSYIEVEELGL
ncbi:DUF4378 domain protein [Medicago truncatula]|uniref:DUF4378 domain protein n=1 Tax=Medicago truncatula TaxID=3880 RepID=G7L5S3_MEDTR|nr:DUF4378 domain protein [Medicago truncatula]